MFSLKSQLRNGRDVASLLARIINHTCIMVYVLALKTFKLELRRSVEISDITYIRKGVTCKYSRRLEICEIGLGGFCGVVCFVFFFYEVQTLIHITLTIPQRRHFKKSKTIFCSFLSFVFIIVVTSDPSEKLFPFIQRKMLPKKKKRKDENSQNRASKKLMTGFTQPVVPGFLVCGFQNVIMDLSETADVEK